MTYKILMSGSALLLSIGAVLFLANDDTSQKDLALIERMTGSHLCSSGSVHDGESVLSLYSSIEVKNGYRSGAVIVDQKKSRETIVKLFDSQIKPCLSFSPVSPSDALLYGRKRGILKNAGYLILDQFRVPLIASRDENFLQSVKNGAPTIFVRIPGGPGQAQIFSQFDLLVDFNNAIVVDFFYTGNGFNLIHDGDNLAVASNQLSIFLSHLRTRNPSAEIVLVGESLGAIISLSALDQIENERLTDQTVVNNLILLSPPFSGLDDVGVKLHKLFGGKGKRDRMVLYRVRQRGLQYNDYGSLQRLDWLEVFRNFYAKSEGATTLYERFSKLGSAPPALIVYGGTDERIGLGHAQKFFDQPIDNVNLAVVEQMGHQFKNGHERNDVRDALNDFLDGRYEQN